MFIISKEEEQTTRKASSLQTFSTEATASLRSSLSCQGSDQYRRTMFRRGAIVSRKIDVHSKSKVETSTSNNGKTFNRRHAITKYSEIPYQCIKSLRRQIQIKKEASSYPFCFKSMSMKENDSMIVFDEDFNLDFDHEGSRSFAAVLRIYYKEEYKYAVSITHESIIRNTILDDVKSRGFSFMKTCQSCRNRARILDDSEALGTIAHTLNIM